MNDPHRFKYAAIPSADFIRLTQDLDQELRRKNGAVQDKFDRFNTLEGIQDTVVAYCGNVAAGCAAMKKYAPGVYEIKRVYVVPDFRKLGLARAMMVMLEEKSREMHLDRLILETSSSFEAAIRLYQSLGYHQIPRYGLYQNMEESFCMERTLEYPA